MDANGLQFWLLADAPHWRLPGDPPALEYDQQRRNLRLTRQRRDLNLIEDGDKAAARLEGIRKPAMHTAAAPGTTLPFMPWSRSVSAMCRWCALPSARDNAAHRPGSWP